MPPTGCVIGSACSKCSVNSRLIRQVVSFHPGPGVGCYVVFPQIVQVSYLSVGIVTVTSEKIKAIACYIHPTRRTFPAPWSVGRISSTHGTVNSVLRNDVISFHPGPCSGGNIKPPEVLHQPVITYIIITVASKHPYSSVTCLPYDHP